MFIAAQALVPLLLAAPSGLAPGVSQASAEILGRKLQALVVAPPPKQRRQALPPMEVSEDELNSYLNLTLRSRLPPEVGDVRLRFERDRLAGRVTVDFDRLRDKLPPLGPFNPLSLLSGRVPAEFTGRVLGGAEGFASVALEEVRLGTLPVPLTLVEQAVVRSTRSAERPEGFDIHAPFRLPYNIRRVRLQPGRALVDY